MDRQTENNLLPPKALECKSRILKSPEGKCNTKNNPVLLPEINEPYRGQFSRLFLEPLPDLEFGLGASLMKERLEKGAKEREGQDLYLPKSVARLVDLAHEALGPPDGALGVLKAYRPNVFIWGSREAGFPSDYPGRDGSEIGLIGVDLDFTPEGTKEKDRYRLSFFPYRLRAYTTARGKLFRSIEGCEPAVARQILTQQGKSPEIISEIIASLEEEDPYISLLNDKCGYRIRLSSDGSLWFGLWINDVRFLVSDNDDSVPLKGKTHQVELWESGDKYGLDKKRAALERKFRRRVSYDEAFASLCLGTARGLTGFEETAASILENYEKR